ncbi:MAG: nitroreductase family protein [Eubacteriales bacterium]|nr:nitroreductase family protein [Eubacteriales bacterium]
MDMMELIRSRHSVRQYTDKAIEPEKREILNTLIEECNKESNLHIQICYDEPECFAGGLAHYGKFEGVANYIALIGMKSAHLEEDCGYYGEKIVLKAQELGLNTCWVALTHGKSKAVIGKGEKQTCLISIGYGKTQGVNSKSKAAAQVSDLRADSPEWFRKGVEAALLAPTAINQQKFFFTQDGERAVAKVKGFGTLTKMDLGIARYHFEAASGHKVIS